MASRSRSSFAQRLIGKYGRTLLATACLTLASGAVVLAGPLTYTENSGGVPNFPANPPAYQLAAQTDGTTIVNGTLMLPAFLSSNVVDWFELTNVGTGTFTVSTSVLNFPLSPPCGCADFVYIYSDTDLIHPLEQSSQVVVGNSPFVFGALPIPADGNLVFEVATPGFTDENPDYYSVTLNATPEPSTILTLGVGLAGVLTLNRKRKRQ